MYCIGLFVLVALHALQVAWMDARYSTTTEDFVETSGSTQSADRQTGSHCVRLAHTKTVIIIQAGLALLEKFVHD